MEVVTYPCLEGLQWPLFLNLFLLGLGLHFLQEMRLAVGLQMCSRAAVDIFDQVEVRHMVLELVQQGIPTEMLVL